MYNPIEEKKKYVKRQVEKSFDNGIDVNNDIQKAKWKVGDEKQYNGVTYVVSGLNAKGTPLWRKKKDGSGGGTASNNQQSSSSNSDNNQAQNQPAKKSKWKVGDEKQYNGVTYFVSGLNAKGTPQWKKKRENKNESGGVVDLKKIPNDEFNTIKNILGKKNPDAQDAFRHLEKEAMSDKELANFYACAQHFKNSDSINKLTQQNCEKWSKLALEEIKNRKSEKKETDKKSNDSDKTSNQKSSGDYYAKKVIDLMQIQNNKYNDISKVSAIKTDKGNWAMHYDGKNTGLIIGGAKLSESELKKLGVVIDDGKSKKSDSKNTKTTEKTASKNDKMSSKDAVNAIKSSNLFSDGYAYSKMGKIASINLGEPSKSGNIQATVIYETSRGSFKSVYVNVDSKGNVKKESGWQPSQAFANVNEAKSYIEYGKRGRDTFNLKWEDSDDIKNATKTTNQNKTGSDFNIVGARAQDVADNVASVLGGKVVGDETVKVIDAPVKIKAYKVKIGNDSFLIHDGVFQRSYSQKGYVRHKGFTIMKTDGSRYMTYKVNSAGNGFTNAWSTTAGDVASHIKQTWGYGS